MLSRVDEDVAQSWLVAAYGEAKAVEVMRVPWELRVQLYPEVLRWGPNGVRVAALLDAVGDPAAASPELRAAADALFDDVFQSGRVWGRKMTVGDAAYLYEQFTVACGTKLNAVRVRAVAIGTLVSALSLSAPWFPVLAERIAQYDDLVDEFLTAAGVPALRDVGVGVAHV